MKEISYPIRTQIELNEVIKNEQGMYYITLHGSVASFGGKIKMNLIDAQRRLEQIAAGSSVAIADALTHGDKKEAEKYLDVLMTTYLIPYRIN